MLQSKMDCSYYQNACNISLNDWLVCATTRKEYKMKKILVVLMAVVMSGCIPSGCGQNYSNGSRVGFVRKFSEKGIFWKSLEGEMMLVAPAGVMMANVDTFTFSVDPQNVELIKKINDAMIKGLRVELKYHQYFIGAWWYDSQYLIDDIVVASN